MPTPFSTGSTGKAFTVAALGILVDQENRRWDDKGHLLAGISNVRPVGDARNDHPRFAGASRSGWACRAGDLLFVRGRI